MSCPPSIPAGERRNLFTIQTEVQTPDGQGGYVKSWVALRSVWFSMKELSDWEKQQHGKLAAGALFKLRCLYVDGKDITPETHRALLGSRLFNIRGVEDEDERHTVIRLRVEEGGMT